MFNKKFFTLLITGFLTVTPSLLSQNQANAAVSNGWYLNGSTWNYYLNGSKAANQWITWNGKQYYMNLDGDMAVNTTIDGWVVGSDGAWDGKQRIITKKGYVFNPELEIDLKVRSVPHLTGTILAYLYNFDNIDILETVTDTSGNVWDKISLNNGYGYVSDAYVQAYVSPPESVVNTARNISIQFETSSVNQIAGNFDREGLSLGYLQWCIGQRTLQPMLNRMDREYNIEMKTIFGTNYGAIHNMLLDTYDNQLKWAYSINTSGNSIQEPWYSQFLSLVSNSHFKQIEDDAVAYTVKQSMLICDKYNLKSIRGFALAFDIVTQNGGISTEASKTIDTSLAQNAGITEKALLKVIADAVSGNSQDVSSRKNAIVNGQGIVHGSMLNLDTNYGLSDNTWR
ncbi:MAG: SH3 domain-containing protein [Solirubrobacterales bacterium]